MNQVADSAWLILVPTLAAFAAIVLGLRRSPAISGWLTVGAVFVAFLLSLKVFAEALSGARVVHSYGWLPVDGLSVPSNLASTLSLGFQVDPLTAIMLIVVSSVSLLVQLYSVGYMYGDRGYARYFAAMALFTTSMLGVVLANNFLAIYIGWELVGLSSYLLIGHWYERPEAAAAAKKAFIVTRLGDVGFLIGILLLFAQTGTLEVSAIAQLAASGQLRDPALTIGILLIFCGAVGKSAQFPLHVWLPDAMEGPTPVSALIHAATMVAAGVYLMARTFPILEQAPTAMTVVAVIGGFTAFFGATMGLTATDIKRVLAYSTMSQLGYMMLAIGVGAMAAGMFHLFNHAFFKALLFLGAGSVIHLVGTNELFEMGGLRQLRPVAYVTMTVAALSLAGIFPLSGFWSKDEILIATATTEHLSDAGRIVLYLLGLATVFLTAFYMFRVIFLTFLGANRGHAREHAEPWTMTVPLLVLLVPTIITGLWGAPLFGSAFAGFIEEHPVASEFSFGTAAASTGLAVVGIWVAWTMYGGGELAGAGMAARFPSVHALLVNRYYVDHLYNWIVGQVVLGIAWLTTRFDTLIIDGAVNGIGAALVAAAGGLRRAQTGQVQTYAWVLFAGAITLAAVAALPLLLGIRR
jgi:NADH-quinone oxidoreductase subunit L